MSSLDEILSLCEARIGYQFRDRTLLRRCLTHSSSAETRLDSNERLEFLGDAVLGLIICEHLFQLYPDQREGQLTQMKSFLVSRQTCARVARLLDLQPLVLVGRGLQSIPESILSAVIESLIAGVYFDGGIEAARQFIVYGFREELSLCRPVDMENYKSQLQEYTQRELGKTPEYLVVEETGPDHAREFGVAARIGASMFEIGRGKSKKEAEQQAARNAVMMLQRPAEETEVVDFIDLQVASGDETIVINVVSAESPADGNCQTAASETFQEDFGEGIADCSPTTDIVSVQMVTNISASAVPELTMSESAASDPDAMKDSMMKTVVTQVLYRPESAALRFLPEGPYSLPDGMMSWVGIQHGADSTTGSINILNPVTRVNQSFDLPGRPGFAFPTDKPGVFVTGFERSVGLFDTARGEWHPFIDNVDSAVTNTIINDAVVFEGNLIFGCKELEFKTQKAGLYLWRRRDRATIQLLDDQICSNGKAVVKNADGTLTLYDIDSCTRQIVRRPLDIEQGTVGPAEVVIDLTSENVFPDGMILTPDQKSLIVALYDPSDPAAGAARQYSIATGLLEMVWTCPGSPRVTCPQLILIKGNVQLVLTSAVENMSAEQLAQHPNAGCLFVGETSFETTAEQPLFASL
jgi:ribonuclease III